MSDLSLQRVGPVLGGQGTATPFRGGITGAQVVQDGHGRYTEAARLGNLFLAHNVAAQAVSVALTTTYTGLCLSNPLGNGKNFSLLAASFVLTVAPVAIASIHLIGGYSATT